jgi:hypothetical protein
MERELASISGTWVQPLGILEMSLADLRNPRAAAESLERFRKRFSAKVCMAPHASHEGSIVAAHTLSVEAMLRKISVDSYVYAASQTKRIAGDTFPIEIQRRGLRDVSVFNGFCQKHDQELFSCLENKPFHFARKQTFMLAYRATARECYLKRKQCESFPTTEEFAAIHGIDEKLEFSDAAIHFQDSALRGAREVEALKATLDRYLMQDAWDRLSTRAIVFPETPSVIATVTFQPFFDMNGTQLQDFENLEAEMSHVCMSVIPLEAGGAAIFSWLDSPNNAPERFFKSVVDGGNLTSSVIHAVFDNTENFALNPTWYEQLTQDKKDYLFSRMMNFELNAAYSEHKRPDLSGPSLDDWGVGVIATF